MQKGTHEGSHIKNSMIKSYMNYRTGKDQDDIGVMSKAQEDLNKRMELKQKYLRRVNSQKHD